MTYFKGPPEPVGGYPPQPPINAFCLLPLRGEYPSRADEPGRKRMDAIDNMMSAFGDRFARAYVLVPPFGVVKLHDKLPKDIVRYEDLTPNRRHLFWMTVQTQLFELLPVGQRIVCMLAGGEMKGLRKLPFAVVVPVAGLSERGRRLWLEQRLAETNFGIAFNLFGGGDELPKPTPDPVTNGVPVAG